MPNTTASSGCPSGRRCGRRPSTTTSGGGGGRHIGNIMYYNHDSARREAELGISIGRRDCWAQGYGADAVAALVSYLFRETELQRLYLHTLDWKHKEHPPV